MKTKEPKIGISELFPYLKEEWKIQISKMPNDLLRKATELRFRLGGGCSLSCGEGNYLIPELEVSPEDMQFLFESMCCGAAYQHESRMENGYISLPGGHRVGVCGSYIEDEKGERIYKDVIETAEKGLQIATVDKLFEMFYESHPNLMFIVEIKDGGERGIEACRILSENLDKYPKYKDKIVIGTFNDEIEQELKTNYPDLLRGAPTGSAAKFVLTQYLGVNIFDNGDFACLQIPLSYDVGVEIPLDSQCLVDRAHRRNIAVQYWTINDADEMRMLIEMGVDCIMTDNPKLLKEVLAEYK